MNSRGWRSFFFLAIFLIFFLPPLDTDLGWHLRYGDYFWRTGKFLTTNEFTLLLNHYVWPHSYTFYQIITALIFKLTKFWGLAFFSSFVLFFAFYFLYLLLEKNLETTLLAFLLITFFSWDVFNLGWRAQIFSFLGISLNAKRNIPFFFLNASLIIFNSSWLKKWQKDLNFISFNRALIILILCGGLFFQFPRTIQINRRWENYCQARKNFSFPCQGVNFLKENNIKGNFYNAYERGGFLEWQLPQSKFFVDGHMPAWPTPSGKNPYTLYLEIIQAQTGWQKILEKYKINYLFIAQGIFLDIELKNNSLTHGWQEIFRDQKAVIYEKKEK
jgi:hypothetical protein